MKIVFAYQGGLAPALAGFYFNARELLARLPADPTLDAARTKALDERKQETVNLVLLGEARAIQAGLPQASVPARPQAYAGYLAWAEALTSFLDGAARRDPREHAAFLLGRTVGDLMTTVALRAFVLELGASDAQQTALRGDERKGLARLALCAENPGLAEPVRAIVTHMLPIARTLDTAADPQAVLKHLSPERAALEKALTLEP